MDKLQFDRRTFTGEVATQDPKSEPPPGTTVLLLILIGTLMLVGLVIMVRYWIGAPLLWWHWGVVAAALGMVGWFVVALSREAKGQ